MADSKISELTSGTPKPTDLHVAVDTTDTSQAPSGTDKKYLWSALKADVTDGLITGPVSSTDNAITRFDGTTGLIIQNSSATLDDSGNITSPGIKVKDTGSANTVTFQSPSLSASYDLTLPVDDGNSGQVLSTNGSGVLSWIANGVGDVVGPASSTDNAIARFDSTTGKLIQNSGAILDDTGNLSTASLKLTLLGTGIAHSDSSGNITSSAIVNADVDASAGIVDTKLATISTAGKVSNSATTATSTNTNSAIVARDGSGNFSAGTITASLTGHASLDLPLTGGTVTGTIIGSSTTAAIFRLNSVTTTQMNAIASPQFGDTCANSTTGQAMFYNGSAWMVMA